MGVWSKLQHPNIVALVGFYLDLETDVAWLLSPWEPFGNIVTYLGENDVDQATRLKLVRLSCTPAGLLSKVFGRPWIRPRA